MKPWPLILPCFLIVATITAATRSVRYADKLNIILVLTDDQGWTDTSVAMMAERPDARSDFYRTPSLERLVKAKTITAWED